MRNEDQRGKWSFTGPRMAKNKLEQAVQWFTWNVCSNKKLYPLWIDQALGLWNEG